MTLRKIGKILRGETTPFQLMAAAVVASILGFMPGFIQAPGIIVFLFIILIITNANLGVAVMISVVAKLVSLASIPISYRIGYALVHGPFESIIEILVNAPVLAFGGFEYYTTTGGFVLGLLFGVGSGLILVKIIGLYRHKMATLEETSEQFNVWNQKGWVKFLKLILIGGRGSKQDYQQLTSRKIGNPIRPLGVVFIILLMFVSILICLISDNYILSAAIRCGLESINEATVDIDQVDTNFKQGKLVLTSLAFTDPNQLDTDLFRADKLKADINIRNLLRKRIVIDKIVVKNAQSGSKRKYPGHRIKPYNPKIRDEPEPTHKKSELSIDNYIENAALWKKRLEIVEPWLEHLSRIKSGDENDSDDLSSRNATDDTLKLKPYISAKAEGLIQKQPFVLISDIELNAVKCAWLNDQTLNINMKNLSSQPWLVPTPFSMSASSSDKLFQFNIKVNGAKPYGGEFNFNLSNIPTSSIRSRLKLKKATSISNGAIDIEAKGSWLAGKTIIVDLPITVTINEVDIALVKDNPVHVSTLLFPITITGPIKHPQIKVDHKQLTSAILKSGTKAVKKEVKRKLMDKLNETLKDKFPGF